jgi:hypothetical protein
MILMQIAITPITIAAIAHRLNVCFDCFAAVTLLLADIG